MSESPEPEAPPELSPELREAIAADPQLTATAERLHEIFSQVDIGKVETAIASGDVTAIAEAMGVSQEELLELGATLTGQAEAYASRFPELNDLQDPHPAAAADAGDADDGPRHGV